MMDEQKQTPQEETQLQQEETPELPEAPEFDLDDIIKEFSDDTAPIAEKTPEQILSEVAREVGAPLPTEEPETPEEEPEAEADVPEQSEAPAADATIRFEAITNVTGNVRNAQRIEDEEEEDVPAAPSPAEKTEPYSEQWEPEYEQPIAEYIPPNPIPFHPRSRLRELKKKLVEGPERMYYTLSEKGVGKLQLTMLGCLLVVLSSAAATVSVSAPTRHSR